MDQTTKSLSDAVKAIRWAKDQWKESLRQVHKDLAEDLRSKLSNSTVEVGFGYEGDDFMVHVYDVPASDCCDTREIVAKYLVEIGVDALVFVKSEEITAKHYPEKRNRK